MKFISCISYVIVDKRMRKYNYWTVQESWALYIQKYLDWPEGIEATEQPSNAGAESKG